MFNKTTSLAFQEYGNIQNALPKTVFSKIRNKVMRIQNKTINRLYSYNTDVFIRVEKGIALLLVSTSPNQNEINRFVIHRVTRIRKGIYFNFIALSSEARITIVRPTASRKTVTSLGAEITYDRIMQTFQCKEIFAYYYQVRNADYQFDGERHPYWELTYVDNGTLITNVEGEEFTLNPGDLIIYTPKQFHTQETPKESSCSYLTVMFDSNFSEPELFSNICYHCNKDQTRILQNFISTTNNSFNSYSHDLLLCYIKELMINLLQIQTQEETPSEPLQIVNHFENELLNEILIYINDNIYKPLAIDELCSIFNVSRSSLQTLFKDNLKVAPKQYINELKLSRSKLLIKEGKYTISEISVMLGFGSIHYFSRKFKQRYKLSPTEYAKSIFN